MEGSTGSCSAPAGDRALVHDVALLVERVPDRERHAEEALAADGPVAVQPVDPVLEARPHERRMPAQLATRVDQLLLMLDRADEPLPARDDLDRPVALLVELHRARDRLRLADEVTRLREQLDDAAPRLVDARAFELGVGGPRPLDVLGLPPGASPGDGQQAPVRAEDRPHREAQLAPPRDVGEVAEGADHHQAGALVPLHQRDGS